MNNLEVSVNKHVKDNIWLYFISIICIFIGMILGVYYIKYMGQADKNSLYNYLYTFTENITSLNIDSKEVFLRAMKNTIPLSIIIWFLGLTVVGIPIILIIDIIKGFTLGFTISSLINSLGGKGIWMSIIGLIPQNMIYLPSIIFISVVAMKFSLSTIKNRLNKQWNTNIVSKIASYSVVILLSVFICFIGFFIEGYFTPSVIKLLV